MFGENKSLKTKLHIWFCKQELHSSEKGNAPEIGDILNVPNQDTLLSWDVETADVLNIWSCFLWKPETVEEKDIKTKKELPSPDYL